MKKARMSSLTMVILMPITAEIVANMIDPKLFWSTILRLLAKFTDIELPSVLCPDRRTFFHAFARSRQGNEVSLESVVISDYSIQDQEVQAISLKVDP
jgi:hypothetical protein